MSFQPGDVVRVLSNNPHNSRLLAGDEVTVHDVKVDREDRTVLYVMTDAGLRAIYAADVEVASRAYRPADPDVAVDAVFEEIVAADRDLVALLTEAEIALGAVDDDLSDILAEGLYEDDEDDLGILDGLDDEDGDEDGMTAEVVRYKSPDESDPANILTVTDAYGDHAVFFYQEARRETGEVIATRVLLQTDYEHGGISIETRWLPDLIRWLHERVKRAQTHE